MVVYIPSFVQETQLVCPIYLCMIPFWTTSNPILISDLANAICFDLCEILTTELISTSNAQFRSCANLKMSKTVDTHLKYVVIASGSRQGLVFWSKSELHDTTRRLMMAHGTWCVLVRVNLIMSEEITGFIVCSALLNEFWCGFTMLQWSFHEQ
jgi:hypothetical protein